MMSLALWTVI